MDFKKPELSQLSEDIIAYIEHLENEINLLKLALEEKSSKGSYQESIPSEPPTTINLLTLSNTGFIKRTPRHFYSRQRRGGMGVFDIELGEDDYPTKMAFADESDTLICLSNHGRLFHIPVSKLKESNIRARGELIANYVPFLSDEKIASILTLKNEGYLAILSQKGYVRVLRHNYVDTNIRSGSPIMDIKRFGFVVDATWIDSDDEIFIGTKTGLGIRFSSKRIHPNGSLGIRLDREDLPVAITRANDTDSVFLLSQDGRGTIRQMEGFRSNKSPGASGKIALKTDELTSAHLINHNDDIFIITKLCKIIRFQANEIPSKTGTVQGVNCMALRADGCTASVIAKIENH